MDDEQKFAAYTLAIVLLRAAADNARRKGDPTLAFEARNELHELSAKRDALITKEVRRG